MCWGWQARWKCNFWVVFPPLYWFCTVLRVITSLRFEHWTLHNRVSFMILFLSVQIDTLIHSISRSSSRICPLIWWSADLSGWHLAMAMHALQIHWISTTVSICHLLRGANYRTLFWMTLLLLLIKHKLHCKYTEITASLQRKIFSCYNLVSTSSLTDSWIVRSYYCSPCGQSAHAILCNKLVLANFFIGLYCYILTWVMTKLSILQMS